MSSRATQFDERMIAVEVTECLRVYGGAHVTVQVFGCGGQVPRLDPCTLLSAYP